MLFSLLSEHPGLLSHHTIHLALAPLARLSDQMLREVIIISFRIRVLVFFVHGRGVDVNRVRLPIVARLGRIVVDVSFSVETPVGVPIGHKDDRVIWRLSGQQQLATGLLKIARILIGGINGAANRVGYRHVVSIAAGERQCSLTHMGQIGISRDRILLRRLGDRNE